jgi:hypothetical protein
MSAMIEKLFGKRGSQMPDLKTETSVRVTVYVSESYGQFGNIQISNEVTAKCRLTDRVGEIVLKRISEMREAIVADLMREGQ